ncbi:MAG: RNA methyltransferase [Acidimicrobiales bacterium]
MRPPALTGRNAKVQRLRRLSARRADRAREGLFVIEGPKLLDEAIAAGIPLEAMFIGADVTGGHPGAGATPVHVVEPKALRAALDTVSPQGVAAIAAQPQHRFDDVDVDGGPILVLAAIGDPGNAGTLVRSAEATGCAAVVFCDGSVDPFAPKSVRASAGSIFRVRVVVEGDGVTVLQRLGERGVRRLGTAARHGGAPEAIDLNGRLALVIGSEAHGLPADYASVLDGDVCIPMTGGVESLNAGVAGSLVLFEAARQRRARL